MECPLMGRKIKEIKEDFVAESDKLGLLGEVDTIFTIGSSSGKAPVQNSNFQDFDIHFAFPDICIASSILDRVRQVFDAVKEKHTRGDTVVDFAVKDLPWKMVPKGTYNIGLHGTVLGKLDFIRRERVNPVLARNMWDNGEVLYGDLCYNKVGLTRKDFSAGVGGTGWLKENFYRFLAIADMGNHHILPAIPEVCYFFGLSPLLHAYYLRNGKTANRAEAYEDFMTSDSPKAVKERVRFIKAHQHTAFPDVGGYERLLNYTIEVINYFHNSFIGGDMPVGTDQTRSLVSCELEKILGRETGITESHFIIPDGNYRQLREAINERMATLQNPRTYSFFDAVSEVTQGERQVSLAYFWTEDNAERREDVDFQFNDTSKLFSWDRGVTTVIQRLHEAVISRDQNELLAKAFSMIYSGAHSDSYEANLRNLGDVASGLLKK